MKVDELMTRKVYTCHSEESLARAAQIMWEHDCGCVPVVDANNHVTGIVTDRDGFIAAYVRGQSLNTIPVATAMAHKVLTCRTDDDVDTAERILRDGQIRRIPVLDAEGRLAGLLSLNDLARRVKPAAKRTTDGLSGDAIALTIAAIGKARHSEAPSAHR